MYGGLRDSTELKKQGKGEQKNIPAEEMTK
jgi:hypothetical protein